MTQEEYFRNLGFDVNPFQYTNADKEVEYIGNYFITPDYFEDVWGDPLNPVSNIVYAPRGGGKTAQRLMIEKRAKITPNVLTVTYANHDLTQYNNINEIDLNYHLTFLNRLLLLAFFSKLENPDIDFTYLFNFNERQYIYKLSRIYLFDTPASFPSHAVNSLKTIEDYAIDIWRNLKEPIANIIKQISSKKGVEIDLSKVEIDRKLEFSHRDNLNNLIQILKKLGVDSVYVLVDKVDEQNLTGNNPENSFKFIEDLLKDLELLETPGLCFKFFLWDALKQYSTIYARPDRVFAFDLQWSWQQLQLMLSKRVNAYSKGKVSNFEKLLDDKKSFGRIILFSELSPRDCIRICNRVLSEQYKANPQSLTFYSQVVNRAIEMFCEDKAKELIPNSNNLNYLKKTNCVSLLVMR